MNIGASHRRWVKSRQILLKKTKEQVRKRLGPEPRDVTRYAKDYGMEFLRPYRVSTKSELLKSIQSSQIVFGGDFHAHRQAQKAHIRILRELEGNWVIALEAIDSQFQKHVNDYLDKKTNESQFLKNIEWKSRWGFDWEHYKPFFDLAKEKKWTVLALNKHFSHRSAKSLRKRDEHAAKVLAQSLSKGSKVYAVFGDLHIARSHLPAMISKRIKNLKSTIVFQNSEHIYFQLAKRGIENQVDVVKFSSREFCILNSAPWTKWQEYLMHLESADPLESLEDSMAINHVFQILKIELHLAFDLDVQNILETQNLRSNQPHVLHLIESGTSVYWPESDTMVISSQSLNQVSSACASYIQAKLSGRQSDLSHYKNDFYKRLWVEMLVFCVSKLVNPKRPSYALEDILNLGTNKSLQSDTLKLCLKVQSHLWNSNIKLSARHKSSWFESARLLGWLYGDKLYSSLRKRDIELENLIEWMTVDVEWSGFESTLWRVLKSLHKSEKVSKSKKERL